MLRVFARRATQQVTLGHWITPTGCRASVGRSGTHAKLRLTLQSHRHRIYHEMASSGRLAGAPAL